jgi:hypothetical protein
MATVAATSTANATQLSLEIRMLAAQTAIAFVTARSAIFTAKPTVPEKNAIARSGSARAAAEALAVLDEGEEGATVVLTELSSARD